MEVEALVAHVVGATRASAGEPARRVIGGMDASA